MSPKISERHRFRSKFRESVGSEEFLQISKVASDTLPFLMTLLKTSSPTFKWFLLFVFYMSELVTWSAWIILSWNCGFYRN